MNKKIANNLTKEAQFALFITSYLPLFVLIIGKQVFVNIDFLNWGGVNSSSIIVFIEKFGLSLVLLLVSIYGYIGAKRVLTQIDESAKINGTPITIVDVNNKGSESVGYIATYIIPFAFQGFDNWFDLISVCFIIYIMYRVYIHSSLLLINPVLNLKYGIFEFKYIENNKQKNGILITKDKQLEEDEKVNLYSIGNKMYYAYKKI